MHTSGDDPLVQHPPRGKCCGGGAPIDRRRFSPALWVLVWLGAACGFLIGLGDGPGAAFVPAAHYEGPIPALAESVASLMQHCHVSGTKPTLYLIIKPMSAALSSGLVAVVMRYLGRKHTISFGCLVHILAYLVLIFNPTQDRMYANRALGGIAEGLLMTMYVGAVELASKYNRGALASFDALGRSIGLMSQGMLLVGLRHAGGSWGIQMFSMFAAYCGGFVLFLLAGGGLPDTPASLVQRGHLQEARESLQMLRNPLMAAETEKEFQLLLQEGTTPHANPIRRSLSLRWLPRTILAVYLALAYNLLGGVYVKYNMPNILVQTLSLTAPQWIYLFYSMITSVGAVLGSLLALATADRIGRRKMMTIVCAMNAVAYSVGLAVIATGESIKSLGGGVVVLTCLVVISAAHATGPQAIQWLFVSEIQPLTTRSFIMGLAIAINSAGQMVTEAVTVNQDCHKAYNFTIVLTVLNVVLGVLMWVLIPETARLDSGEIDRAFDRHWLWGWFSKRAAARALRAAAHAHEPPAGGARGLSGMHGWASGGLQTKASRGISVGGVRAGSSRTAAARGPPSGAGRPLGPPGGPVLLLGPRN